MVYFDYLATYLGTILMIGSWGIDRVTTIMSEPILLDLYYLVG